VPDEALQRAPKAHFVVREVHTHAGLRKRDERDLIERRETVDKAGRCVEDWAERPEKAWHLRWREVITGELVVDTVPGTHGDLVGTESSAALARIIRRTVDRITNVALVAPCMLAPAFAGSSYAASAGAVL